MTTLTKRPARRRRAALPANTVEVHMPLCVLPAEVSDRVLAYVKSATRWQPHVPGLQVDWTDASIGTQTIQITYPPTGEQQALAAYDRFCWYGVPARYLRVRGEPAGGEAR